MSNTYFQFKHFIVNQDKCAMKVGTDGVLLGAWFDLQPGQSVLDIGTGTGLVALMAAQRGGIVTAVEIDADAAAQARENAQATSWPINVITADISTYRPGTKFDRIVSNPPYFRDSLRCPDSIRNAARHNDSLSYETLIAKVIELLSAEGEFSVVLPTDTDFVRIAQRASLFLIRSTQVMTAPGKQPKRELLTFARQIREITKDTLDMTSPEYVELVRDFYLKY